MVVTCSNALLIPPCCSYYELQLCAGARGMVFGEVKQSTIYAKFGDVSSKNKRAYHGRLSTITS